MSLTLYMTSSNLINHKTNFGVLLMYISMDRTGSIISVFVEGV